MIWPINTWGEANSEPPASSDGRATDRLGRPGRNVSPQISRQAEQIFMNSGTSFWPLVNIRPRTVRPMRYDQRAKPGDRREIPTCDDAESSTGKIRECPPESPLPSPKGIIRNFVPSRCARTHTTGDQHNKGARKRHVCFQMSLPPRCHLRNFSAA